MTSNSAFNSVVLLVLAVGLASTASAQAESAKLLAGDGATGDSLGYSVGAAGATAIVGAVGDNDNGPGSGSAYIFDTTTGAQIAKLLPSDGAAGDGFGIVGIDGFTAIVGAPGHDGNGPESGSAYLFDPATGVQLAKLLARDGGPFEWFGWSVGISGTIAIVAAPFDDDNGSDSGSVYLFDTKTGAQIAKLLAGDGAPFDNFGWSVGISGTTAIVGAPGGDDNGSNSGSVYLFDVTTGVQIAKLLASDGAVSDLFGWSVAISGTTAIVGAARDDAYGLNSGSAYLFDTTTGAQIAKLLPMDGAASDSFGQSVGIAGTTAVVGAHFDDDSGSGSGSAYLFDATTGAQVAKLLPSDGAASDLFGVSVAISGTTATVGAGGDDDNGTDSGSAYLFKFDCNGNGIADYQDITNGTSADCNANGLPDECEIDADPSMDWNGDGILDVCTPPNYCSANSNSTGQSAVMSLSGSPLIVEDNFTLTAAQMPPNEFGYFLMADSQGFIPNVGGSSGNLCLGTPLYRFVKPPSGQVLSSGAAGTFSFSPDLNNLPQGVVFQVGETWDFQAWFRDGAGSTSNFTDGIEVMFR